MPNHSTPVRIPDLAKFKSRGRKITMLTAYDATMARLLDRAGVDVLLVGDSLGMVIMGYPNTIPVTLEAVLHHTAAVVRGTARALVVADLPFLTYQVTPAGALRNAGRLLQEGGATAVKLEGGLTVADTVARLVDAGIPVMGHIGLTPQAINQLGGFHVVGKTEGEADALLAAARALETAGAFAIVLECIPDALAARITAELRIPTIGIGSGPQCEGQVLVSYDALGLYDGAAPPFVKRYADLAQQIDTAVKEYIADVQEGRYPCPRK